MTTEPLKTAAIGSARDYQTLPAWQKSMSLAERTFQMTEGFPEREHEGLAAQLRQSIMYVASAIAGASTAADETDISDYYREAQSALAEFATQVELASRLSYLGAAESQELTATTDDVARLLIGMQHGLRVAARDAERATRDAERAERNAAREERGGDRPFRKPYEKREGSEDRPRRDFKPRDREERGDRPYKKPFKKFEDGESRPRRDFKERGERGDKPFRKREDRDGGDRPRRDFKERGERGDKPFRKREDRDGGDRPYKKREDTRGDRKGYGGSKKPYAKRDFGGKPKRRD